MSSELILTGGQYTRTGHQLQNITCLTLNCGTGIFQNLTMTTLNCGTGIAASQFISPNYSTSGSVQTFNVAGTAVFQTVSHPQPALFPYDDNTQDCGLSSGNNWRTVNTYLANVISSSTGALSVANSRIAQKEYTIISYNNAVQSVTNNLATALAFNTDGKNVNWTSSRADNTKFIGVIPGYYRVDYMACVSATQTIEAKTQFYSVVTLNGVTTNINSGTGGGSAINGGYTSTTSGLNLNGSCVVYMNGSSDYVQISVLHDCSLGALNFGYTGTKTGGSNIISITYLHA